jgi:hypothetical protein
LEENISDEIAVEKFYDLFKSACPNSADYEIEMTTKFKDQLAAGYTGDALAYWDSMLDELEA